MNTRLIIITVGIQAQDPLKCSLSLCAISNVLFQLFLIVDEKPHTLFEKLYVL